MGEYAGFNQDSPKIFKVKIHLGLKKFWRWIAGNIRTTSFDSGRFALLSTWNDFVWITRNYDYDVVTTVLDTMLMEVGVIKYFRDIMLSSYWRDGMKNKKDMVKILNMYVKGNRDTREKLTYGILMDVNDRENFFYKCCQHIKKKLEGRPLAD